MQAAPIPADSKPGAPTPYRCPSSPSSASNTATNVTASSDPSTSTSETTDAIASNPVGNALALSVSPAAAFARLGITDVTATIASSPASQTASITPTASCISTVPAKPIAPGNQPSVLSGHLAKEREREKEGKKISSSTASARRRLSTATKRPALPPHLQPHHASHSYHHQPAGVAAGESGGPGAGLSHSLPASSLLLLGASAEAAVLESMRFEQSGGRAAALPLPSSHKPSSGGGTAAAAVWGPSSGATSGKAKRSVSGTGAKEDREKEAGWKREKGVFKCEKCAKVYRHPQCLVKHRWEHTSYWADASKLMLSKHQQVQMLEAAAILATPSGSLPESRSLWPAAVSPSAAGLYGSDQVNIDVLRSSVPKAGPVVVGGTSNSALESEGKLLDDEVMRDAEDGNETGEAEAEEQEDEDDVMFDMSINGDDSQSASGASTADTTSPGEGEDGEGDEKDSGYASGSTRGGLAVQGKDPGRVATGQGKGVALAVSAPPPMGYFDTHSRSFTAPFTQAQAQAQGLGSAQAQAQAQPQTLAPTPALAAQRRAVSAQAALPMAPWIAGSPHPFPAPPSTSATIWSSAATSLSNPGFPSHPHARSYSPHWSASAGAATCLSLSASSYRPGAAGYLFQPEYAASDVRNEGSAAAGAAATPSSRRAAAEGKGKFDFGDEEEDEAGQQPSGRWGWRREVSDEVADMEL